MTFALFLRGINVGGIKVPMADLKNCLHELGLKNVKTFVQTGNVLFDSALPSAKLKPAIEKALSQRFNYTAFVLLYPATVLAKIVVKWPFKPNPSSHRYAIFCQSQTVVDDLMAHKNQLDTTVEDIAPGASVAYWRVPIGSTAGTPFGKILAKPKYKATTTNRNLNTLEKML